MPKKRLLKAIKEPEAKYQGKKAFAEQTISQLDKAIAIIKDETDNFSKAVELVESRSGKDNEFAEAVTVLPFLNLSILDILILSKQYLRTDDIIEKNFICRTAAHHMYEFLEDASRALGKQSNQIVGRLNNAPIDIN